ncbi:hypothetical protein FRB99_004281 [Tulasnella sp. 403]|nr:hypothetical protein FRB99_004281 [Tulasnella sp. 403]
MSNSYGEPTCIEYSRSGKYLVAGTSTSYVVVWDVEMGQISRIISVPQTQSTPDDSQTGMKKVDVSWDDTLVASVLESSNIHLDSLGDVRDGRRLVPIERAQVVTFSPKSDVVAVGLVGGGVQIFSVDTGESLGMINGPETPVFLCFSSDGRWLLDAGWEGIRKWDTRELTKRTPKTIYNERPIRAASMPSDDDDMFAFTDYSREVYVRMNWFDDSAVNHHVGSLPFGSLVKHAGPAIVGLEQRPGSSDRFRVWKVASYDSPGTYRLDPMLDDE